MYLNKSCQNTQQKHIFIKDIFFIFFLKFEYKLNKNGYENNKAQMFDLPNKRVVEGDVCLFYGIIMYLGEYEDRNAYSHVC